jgi:hypothetical protein
MLIALLVIGGVVAYVLSKPEPQAQVPRPGSTTSQLPGVIAPGSKLNIFTTWDHPWSIAIGSDTGATCDLVANHTMPPCSLLIPENATVLHLEATFKKLLIYDHPPRNGFVWYGCDEGPRSKTCTFTVTRPGGVCIAGVDSEFVQTDGCTQLAESGVLGRLPKASPVYTRDPVSGRLMWKFPPGVCDADGMALC